MIARLQAQHTGAARGRVRRDRTRVDAILRLFPLDAVGQGRLVREALCEVERAGSDEQSRHQQQHPSPCCQHRSFHDIKPRAPLLNR